MSSYKWIDNKLQIKPPKRTKKVTGTRFASILGSNIWSTPFEMWLAITKTYEKPFEDTIYTLAGKAIEPKQAEYMKDNFLMDNLVSPTDVYGKDYFKKTWGDFFPENKHFGGMWDFLLVDSDNKPTTVLEMKTSKRVEDWIDDIPEYYALQASLYAYLLGVDEVVFVTTFLQPNDYENVENFEVNSKNTITRKFKLSERYPNFQQLVDKVERWWEEHVDTGISPEYDEKKDAELLKALRTNDLSLVDDKDLIKEAEKLQAEIDEVNLSIKDKEKRLKEIKDTIKDKAVASFRDGDSYSTLQGERYVWTVAKSETVSIDKKALEKDGLLDKYSTIKEQYRLTLKEIK